MVNLFERNLSFSIDVNLSAALVRPSVAPSFLYLESNIRLGNLDDSGFHPSFLPSTATAAAALLLGCLVKKPVDTDRTDSVDRGRGEGGGTVSPKKWDNF